MTWNRASASQCKTFLRCAARWYWESVQGHRAPPTEAMIRGTRVHAAIEAWLVHGTPVPEGEIGDIAQVALPRLPLPCVPPSQVELRFTDIFGGVLFRGIIDLVHEGAVIDHKTTSSLKYALTDFELRNDPQACAYVAHMAAQWPEYTGSITFRHDYLTTRKPYKNEWREHTFTRDEIDEARTWIGGVCATMRIWALASPEHIPHNLTACNDYRSRANPDGCPHRARCAALGRPTMGFASLFYFPTKAKGDDMTAIPNPLAALGTDPLDAVKAEIMQRMPEVQPEHFEGKTPDEIHGILAKLRETQSDAINPPDGTPPTAPVETADRALVKKGTTRGARMPDEYGGELVSRTNGTAGHLQAYLVAQGCPVPTGKGSTKRMRELCARVLHGLAQPGDAPDECAPYASVHVAAPPVTPVAAPSVAPVAVPPLQAPNPTPSARTAVLARIRGLVGELGMHEPVGLDTLADAALVEYCKTLEVEKANRASVQVPPPVAPAPPSVVPAPPVPSNGQAPTFATVQHGFVLYVDCRPDSEYLDASKGLAPQAATIAEAHKVPHHLAMSHGEGSKQFAALCATQIAAGQLKIQGGLYVSSRTPSGPALIEALAPLADAVVRGDR